jgi:hypothetical protein
VSDITGGLLAHLDCMIGICLDISINVVRRRLEWVRVSCLDGIEPLICETISAGDDGSQTVLDRLGEVQGSFTKSKAKIIGGTSQ